MYLYYTYKIMDIFFKVLYNLEHDGNVLYYLELCCAAGCGDASCYPDSCGAAGYVVVMLVVILIVVVLLVMLW